MWKDKLAKEEAERQIAMWKDKLAKQQAKGGKGDGGKAPTTPGNP